MPSSLPSSIDSSSGMDVQTPEGCTGMRRVPNTHLESLHLSEEVQRLDSRFNSVDQRLTAQHEADFAAYPPATTFQSLHSTVYTLQTVMRESIRAKPPLHVRTTSSAAARTSQTPAEATSSATPRPPLTSSYYGKLTPTFPSRVTSPATKQLTILCPIPSRPSSIGGRSLSIEPTYPSLHSTTSFSNYYLSDVNSPLSLFSTCTTPLAPLKLRRYPKADSPGRRLWQLTHDLNLSLLTDPTQPTRIGNTLCHDTTRDLIFCRRVREDLSTWTNQLLADLDEVNASISTTEDHPATDCRLAHLWATRSGLSNGWHKQRHNRRLPCRIAPFDLTIEQHTIVLARQQWEQFCSGLSNQLRFKQSWHLLRHFLDPASGKHVRLIPAPSASWHAFSPSRVLLRVPQSELDTHIMEAEVYVALQKLRTTSAPVRISSPTSPSETSTPIRSQPSRRSSTSAGAPAPALGSTETRHPQRKHARLTFIAKPGKKLTIENLRPTSLVLCLGRLLENLLLPHLQTYTDAHHPLTLTMLGFHPTFPHKTFSYNSTTISSTSHYY
ncbi:hypothetical protein HPB52_001908 [Rhipicephalus sanguineus]|uniref:Uncharacterized protein n=1 Tax=Rhipicephalus sanguineus TaxID=34632 RepID=A0A9D4PGN3_RHISA|nr:hypothetical protein HPB52_001908 [Rhipicephalus sanguineus]